MADDALRAVPIHNHHLGRTKQELQANQLRRQAQYNDLPGDEWNT